MGRREQVIVDANNQAHQLDFNAEASSWIFMLNACEELLPSDKVAGFKEACKCAFGQQGESYTEVKQRLEQRMHLERAQVGEAASQEHLQLSGLQYRPSTSKVIWTTSSMCTPKKLSLFPFSSKSPSQSLCW